MVRLLSAIVSLAILAGGVFFARAYYQSKLLLLYSNPSIALDVSNSLLHYLLISSIVALFLFSLLVYLLLTTRVAARRLAYKLTKDIYLSQEQFRRFYEYSPVPYLLISRDGAIERPNTASVRLLALTHEQLMGQSIFSFLRTPDDVGKIERIREQVVRRVPIEKRELQVVPHDGVPRWTLMSIEDLCDPRGEHHGLVTLVDIHEQKELDRIKTEFLSLASHQLRAPLANLKWYIDFLLTRRSAALTEEVAEYLHKMYRRNEDMIDLVNTLLNLSRIEMGRISVQKENTDVSALARSVVEEMEPQAQQKQIALVAEVGDSLHFNTDPKLVRIVLQNLLANGLRYTQAQGTVTVRVATTANGITWSVDDTGVGIPTEEHDHIFQKMYRATNAKEMETNGNGIGLYMCKALVESLGGTISFTSTLGKGTSFVVTLQR